MPNNARSGQKKPRAKSAEEKAARLVKIMELRARGHTYREIAVSLQLDERTVRRNIKSCMGAEMLEEVTRWLCALIRDAPDWASQVKYLDALQTRLMGRGGGFAVTGQPGPRFTVEVVEVQGVEVPAEASTATPQEEVDPDESAA